MLSGQFHQRQPVERPEGLLQSPFDLVEGVPCGLSGVLAELEQDFDEVERQQEELWDLIRRKRARLAKMGHPVPLDG